MAAARWRLYGALTLTIVLWSWAFPAIRAGLTQYSPTQLVLLRFLVASLCFVPLVRRRDFRWPEPGDRWRIFMAGSLGIAVYQFALNFGEKTVNAGTASLLINSAPIWTALFSRQFLNERLRRTQGLGVLLGFCGVCWIFLGQTLALHLGPGTLLVLLAALAHSLSFVIQKPVVHRYPPLRFAAYLLWSGTLWFLPFAGPLPATILHASPSITACIVFLGVGPAAIAYSSWTYALSRLSPSKASSFLYGVPVCAIFIAWLWLGEIPSLAVLAGGALAMAGIFLVHRRDPAEFAA